MSGTQWGSRAYPAWALAAFGLVVVLGAGGCGSGGVPAAGHGGAPSAAITSASSPVTAQAGGRASSTAPARYAAPGTGTSAPAGSPAPSGSAIAALVQLPDAGTGQLDSAISGASRTLDMVMYELSDTTVEQLLIDRAKAGVQVRVLLDKSYDGGPTNQAAFDRLKAGGVQVEWAPAGIVYHEKAFVVDGHDGWIGTGNLTSKYYADDRDAWFDDRDSAQVVAIDGTFAADWAAAPGQRMGAASQTAGLLWSPGAEQSMVATIASATRQVDFTSEELSDAAVISALEADARRGVRCEVVMTRQADWLTAFAELRSVGCQVHTYPDASHVLYIHEKQVIVDGTKVLVGSHNAGSASLTKNRELSLELTDPAIVSTMGTTFDSDFSKAPQTS